MTIIHAYIRTKPISVDLFNKVVDFQANEKGHIVAEVKEKRVADRLLSISEGYRVYDDIPLEVEEDDAPIQTSPYLLTQEGDDGREVTVDLRTLDRAELVKFCADNDIPAPHHKTKDETVRDAIVAFFKVE